VIDRCNESHEVRFDAGVPLIDDNPPRQQPEVCFVRSVASTSASCIRFQLASVKLTDVVSANPVGAADRHTDALPGDAEPDLFGICRLPRNRRLDLNSAIPYSTTGCDCAAHLPADFNWFFGRINGNASLT
jgi:hypothetical protein